MKVELFDNDGTPLLCILCKVNLPMNLEFGILCKDCIDEENAKWKRWRDAGIDTSYRR